jgi:hypothetical protein
MGSEAAVSMCGAGRAYHRGFRSCPGMPAAQ